MARDAAKLAEWIKRHGPSPSRAGALRTAMDQQVKFAAEYTTLDGRTREIVARPYSVRDRGADGQRLLYVQIDQDRHGGGQIHSLRLSRLHNVTLLGRSPFRPRWPTEPGTV